MGFIGAGGWICSMGYASEASLATTVFFSSMGLSLISAVCADANLEGMGTMEYMGRENFSVFDQWSVLKFLSTRISALRWNKSGQRDPTEQALNKYSNWHSTRVFFRLIVYVALMTKWAWIFKLWKIRFEAFPNAHKKCISATIFLGQPEQLKSSFKKCPSKFSSHLSHQWGRTSHDTSSESNAASTRW